jgi:hypothetical protein
MFLSNTRIVLWFLAAGGTIGLSGGYSQHDAAGFGASATGI